jgi:hypothetical protein
VRVGCRLCGGADRLRARLRRPVPEDLAEVWNWYEAGHWPSGFAGEPGSDPAAREGKHLVFPRRLLVY